MTWDDWWPRYPIESDLRKAFSTLDWFLMISPQWKTDAFLLLPSHANKGVTTLISHALIYFACEDNIA